MPYIVPYTAGEAVWVMAEACRSERHSAFVDLLRRGWRSNRLLWFGVAVEVVFTALLLGWPPLSRLFAMAPLERWTLPLIVAAPLLVMLADDLRKRSDLGQSQLS